jgi:hypothetical protein
MITKSELKTQLATALADAAAWKARYDALVAEIVKAMEQQNPPPPPTTTQKGISVGGDFQNWPASDRARYLDLYAGVAKWLRVDVNYGSEAGGLTVIAEARVRGMTVLPVLIARGAWPLPSDFGAWAGKMAGQIRATAYEIGNEPNLTSFFPSADPASYVRYLNSAYEAIKAVHPAQVISGGLSPATNLPGFAEAVATTGKFDGFGWHPYCSDNGNLPGSGVSWSAWTQMDKFKAAHPTVPIWGTEFGAPTGGVAPAVVDEPTQVKIITQGYSLWRDTDGPLFIYQGRDKGTGTSREDHYGLLRADWTEKPAYQAFKEA